MIGSLSGNERKVYTYLQRISPQWATNTQIEEATHVRPHQQVFQITQRLLRMDLIRGVQGRSRVGEWEFSIQILHQLESKPETQPAGTSKRMIKDEEHPISAVEFERLAERAMGRHFGVSLRHGGLPGVPKDFDLVSEDGNVVGDAKYFTLVRGERLPPAKFSVIAEHVWLLEKTSAIHRFLVFGNQRAVPEMWLKRYGHLVGSVEFYFLTNEGHLERLK